MVFRVALSGMTCTPSGALLPPPVSGLDVFVGDAPSAPSARHGAQIYAQLIGKATDARGGAGIGIPGLGVVVGRRGARLQGGQPPVPA